MSYQDYIFQNEEKDGIRFTWNAWPKNKVEASKMIIPVGCIFTPAKIRTDLPQINYEPISCQKSNCRSIVNPYCQVDFRNKSWICVFCNYRNQFPPQYNGITEQQQPAEILAQFTTIEYTLNKTQLIPPIYLFVVDTCLDEEDLNCLKNSIKASISNMQPNCLVGLITFGNCVFLHELVPNFFSRSYAFRGTKDITVTLIKDVMINASNQLNQNQTNTNQPSSYQENSQSVDKANITNNVLDHSKVHHAFDRNNRFLQPISHCLTTFIELIESLTKNSWPVMQGKRPQRSVGAALSVAVSLLEQNVPNTGARVLLFLGGPCTQGPGQVIDNDLKNVIRSHKDIASDNTPFMKKATKFYEGLVSKASDNGHSIDIFACCLDQTGLHEMKSCCNKTGGYMLMADSFDSEIFKQTLQKSFSISNTNDYAHFFNGSIEIKLTSDLKISGLIGNCKSMAKKDESVSDTEIGIGGTYMWKLGCLDQLSSFSAVFEVVGNSSQNKSFVQFITSYQTSGTSNSLPKKKIRVTTCCRQLVDSQADAGSMIASFDCDASAALIAKVSAFRCSETVDSPIDVLRWIDRLLIRLCQRFGDYVKEVVSSFRLPENFALFPQYMFHLRRSQYLRCFNNSPDETAFYRHCIIREDVTNCCIMIQPVLFSYSLEASPQPVSLDSSSIKPDTVLLLDTFFHILIYYGETVDSWCKQGYHLDPNYGHVARLVQMPIDDGQQLLRWRFPVPRYIVTEHNGSQARFLLSKVNPSQTHTSYNAWNNDQSSTTILTDDVSLQIFMEHLKKSVVTNAH